MTQGAFPDGRGGRDAHGIPRFDQTVPKGGYLWWYLDALSDDGRHGLSIIAFVGSVFSPYYAFSRAYGKGDPEDFCAINVALYGDGGKRWAMTERGRRSIRRNAREFVVGPSRMAWDGEALVVDFDERSAPLPRAVKGRIRLVPSALCRFVTPLDAHDRHRWGPIAPCARIEVTLDQPGVSWSGAAYMDSNEGDEPIEKGFVDWDWSRARMHDGSTAVIYDVRPSSGPGRVIAQRFAPDGTTSSFEPPARQQLPASMWRVARAIHTDAGRPARVLETLEDTPFYVRSTLASSLLGEPVTSIHESLSVPRLVSLPVRLMLPWRMPRLA
jgi:carotenoid 1,2-hydratase